jgi:hypothetical protein
MRADLPPPVPLPPPPAALTHRAARDCGAEAWERMEVLIGQLMDAPTWVNRAEMLIAECSAAIDLLHTRMSPLEVGIVVSRAITIAVEGLALREVSAIEPAAITALSFYPAWRKAGVLWMSNAGDLARRWVADRPDFQWLAKHVRFAHPSIPAWLEGGVDG